MLATISSGSEKRGANGKRVGEGPIEWFWTVRKQPSDPVQCTDTSEVEVAGGGGGVVRTRQRVPRRILFQAVKACRRGIKSGGPTLDNYYLKRKKTTATVCDSRDNAMNASRNIMSKMVNSTRGEIVKLQRRIAGRETWKGTASLPKVHWSGGRGGKMR